ncbi:serine acetyltransferase 2-like protein [Tanacetum coccineum]
MAACLGPLSETHTIRTVLEKYVDDGQENPITRSELNGSNPNSPSTSSISVMVMRKKVERIFPVYARGGLSPRSDPVYSGLSLGDKIWDSVRLEAKCENDMVMEVVYLEFDVMMCVKKKFTSVGYHSLQTHRVAHALWNQGRKLLALALQSRVSEVFGIDIHPAAKIGEGILLDHGTGLVIGETAVIGDRVSLMQGVTLGGSGKETGDRHPKVGEGVLIGASVTVLGNIKIGEGAMIASGSLVLKDIPQHSMAAGIPAKVIGYVEEQVPSLTMKHDASKDFFEHVAISKEVTGEEYPL